MIDLALWSAGGRSARGTDHQRAGKPNQDALAVAGGPVALVAVADGHGSSRCTRSEIGAALAVDVAAAALPAFVRDARDLAALRAVLAAEVVGAWRTRVADHLAAHPLEHDEAERVAGSPTYAYGATLLAAAAHGETLLAVQIGDGELWLADAGGVRRAIARDFRFAFNATASLALDDAEAHVRVARLTVAPPALAVVATDGYAKPFATDRAFAVAVGALYARAQTADLERVLDAFPCDEAGADRHGGDDVTVGIVARA